MGMTTVVAGRSPLGRQYRKGLNKTLYGPWLNFDMKVGQHIYDQGVNQNEICTNF